jgi:hypothetical protein
MPGCALLLAGLPATGKTSFCRYLSRERGFAHYDMECWPKGWPAPELHPTWNTSRSAFVDQLRRRHSDWVLDWGFPPRCLTWVSELEAAGVRLVWFSGDVARVRILFEQRGGQPMSTFDDQVAAIAAAGFPQKLRATVVNTLSKRGTLRPMSEIYDDVFLGPPNPALQRTRSARR